jgi:hypothetical protein
VQFQTDVPRWRGLGGGINVMGIDKFCGLENYIIFFRTLNPAQSSPRRCGRNMLLSVVHIVDSRTLIYWHAQFHRAKYSERRVFFADACFRRFFYEKTFISSRGIRKNSLVEKSELRPSSIAKSLISHKSFGSFGRLQKNKSLWFLWRAYFRQSF